MPCMSDVTPVREATPVEAGGVLRAGGLVLIPTETFYAVAASARSGVERLRGLIAARSPGAAIGALTWHAPTRKAVHWALGKLGPAHRRAVNRLTPGPVRLVVEHGATDLGAAGDRLGVKPGVIDDGTEMSIRVPDHDVARQVIETACDPVVAARADALGLGDGVRLTPENIDAAVALGISVVQGGTTPSGRGSATMRLHADGMWSVPDGGDDLRRIERRMARLVLFVCTGNTCRSPMAWAIAQDAGERVLHEGISTTFRSAGLHAISGDPMTPEAREALESLHVSVSGHRSRPLDRGLAHDAEVIFAMTRSHLAGLKSMGADVAAKAHLLDPDGGDVPDPIGQGPEVYRETALRLRNLVERRLRELDEPLGAAS